MTQHSGWTAVPHGLWTLPCSERAKVVLGWLWSHNDRFLERMSVREAARQMGYHHTQMVRAIDELTAGGLLTVEVERHGESATIRLDHDAWQALHDRLVVRLPD